MHLLIGKDIFLAKRHVFAVEKIKGRLGAVFFNPQSSRILGEYSRGEEPSIRFWSLDNGKLSHLIQLGYREWITAIAISHDENMIAVASFHTNTVGCFSINKDTWLWKSKWIEKDPFHVKKVLFTPDDQKILAFGEKHIVTYNSQKGEINQKQTQPLSQYSSLPSCRRMYVVSPSGRYFLVSQGPCLSGHAVLSRFFLLNKKVTIWDLERNEIVARWEKESEICAAVFSPNEKEIVIGSCDGHIIVRPISEDKVIRKWRAHTNVRYPDADFQLQAIIFSTDGEYLATYGVWEDGWDGVKVWDYENGKLIHSFYKLLAGGVLEQIYPMAFSPDGKYFALEQQGNLCLYDTQTWQERWCVPSVKSQE